jgi:hypothetical protein
MGLVQLKSCSKIHLMRRRKMQGRKDVLRLQMVCVLGGSLLVLIASLPVIMASY